MKDFSDTVTRTRVDLLDAAGETVWYSVPVISRERDEVTRVIAEGGKLSETTYTAEVSACDKVINAAMREAIEGGYYEDGDENLVGLDMQRFLNMTADAGRPSDAARSVVRSYRSSPAQFRLDFKKSRANDSIISWNA